MLKTTGEPAAICIFTLGSMTGLRRRARLGRLRRSASYRSGEEGRRDHLQRLTKMFRHAASWASRPLCRGDRVHPTGQGLRGIGSGSRTRTARQSYGRAKRSGRLERFERGLLGGGRGAVYKPDSELLDQFIKRKGGINACAARFTRFTRCFGRDKATRSQRRSVRG